MFDEGSTRISLRMPTTIHRVLDALAGEKGIETNAYIQWVLEDHAVTSGKMDAPTRARVELSKKIIAKAQERARELYQAGRFDEHFTLTVFKDLIDDDDFRIDYETFVRGKASEPGLPGKFPINMFLGWYIKDAVGAQPLMDRNGKPRRAQVRGQPIQSYTLLKKNAA